MRKRKDKKAKRKEKKEMEKRKTIRREEGIEMEKGEKNVQTGERCSGLGNL